MKWLNNYRIKLVVVGFLVAIISGGESAKAEITISEPVNLGPVINDDTDMQEGDFSHDGLEFYFSSYNRPGGYGLPGQVILSQIDNTNLLSANTSDGCLMTDEGTFRGKKPLLSQTVITNGDWHPVGLTWDGSNRILYVDDVIVAQDTQGNLPSSESGLYIGAGKDLDEGTFFSGSIDDVRIYKRVITP